MKRGVKPQVSTDVLLQLFQENKDKISPWQVIAQKLEQNYGVIMRPATIATRIRRAGAVDSNFNGDRKSRNPLSNVERQRRFQARQRQRQAS